MPQYAGSIHCTENYLQLNNDPLVYLKNTPQMEPRIIKTVNKLNNAPLGAHLNQMKGEYAPVR